MSIEQMFLRIDRETGEVLDELSPSKILAWAVVLFEVALLIVWLVNLGAGEEILSAGDLGIVLVVGTVLAVGLYRRPGDLVDAGVDRLKERGKP